VHRSLLPLCLEPLTQYNWLSAIARKFLPAILDLTDGDEPLFVSANEGLDVPDGQENHDERRHVAHTHDREDGSIAHPKVEHATGHQVGYDAAHCAAEANEA